jgi:glycosyltransferase involved in cell wall biosynthesis
MRDEPRMSRTVWIICQYAGSPRHGMNYRPYFVGRELARNGYRVCIISGSFSHQYISLPPTTGRFTLEEIDGLTYCWVKTPAYPDAGSLWRAYSWLAFSCRLLLLGRSLLPRPDVVLVSSPMPFPIVNGFFLSRRHRARLVFEVRDIWPLSLVEIGGVNRLHPLVVVLQALEDFACRTADLVVSVLPRAYDHLRRRGLSKDRFAWIPNGVEISAADEAAAAADAGDGHTRDAGAPFLIGYAGSVNRTNAMGSFIEAAILLKDDDGIRFVVRGSGDELDALKARARGAGARVAFEPPVAKTRMPEILRAWDACYIGWRDLRMYRYGTSANKVFDYMLAGKPILQSIRPGDDVLLAIGCGLNALPEDPASIAAAVRSMTAMPGERLREMGNRGRQYVMQHHDYRQLGRRYARLLDRLVEGKGP